MYGRFLSPPHLAWVLWEILGPTLGLRTLVDRERDAEGAALSHLALDL